LLSALVESGPLNLQGFQQVYFGTVQQSKRIGAGGPGAVVEGFEVDPGEGDGHKFQIRGAVALFEVIKVGL
jgi:hypothetical protein